MSEHNKNFYSLKEVERCLEASKEFQDGEEIYYFIGVLRYVYDENKQLKSQLQQKENTIKEVREYIKQLLEYKKEDYYKGISLEYVERILDILEGNKKWK